MKKAVWISFLAALIVINVAAWLMEYFAGVSVAMPYRLAVVLGITLISMVFAGAWALVGHAEGERESDKRPSDSPDR